MNELITYCHSQPFPWWQGIIEITLKNAFDLQLWANSLADGYQKEKPGSLGGYKQSQEPSYKVYHFDQLIPSSSLFFEYSD